MPDLTQTSAYDFVLPETQIATHPADPRDSARLLVVDGDARQHLVFRDIVDWFKPGDCLVVNDVMVQKARFYVRRATGAVIEVLLTDDVTHHARIHTCLYRGGHFPADEILIAVNDETIQVRLWRDTETRESLCYVEFLGSEPIVEMLGRVGQLPLPPYIVKRRKTKGDSLYEASDDKQYQTVYAQSGSAVAAPTAGLHFTPELIQRLQDKGVTFARLRLDVGPGTFRPVQTESLDAHVMHSERYFISPELADALAKTRLAAGRVVAVGTTVVRSLEDQFARFGKLVPGTYETDIFIRPGFRFGVVDAMITNFHLPGSTLMVLVSAFGGHETIMTAYADAIAKGYRFYSYGDAMLLMRI
ncbi:MAG: tRNA preQ1(34) S-adenosylmethionine ribosyltransferase-isomerase QueA [Proteobacteria bacterium]|nr:tRNA preQ1(34) S-adenosylmethionine ribosyltransferase-isomerase QueA [Pseudomonadota bacterium]